MSDTKKDPPFVAEPPQAFIIIAAEIINRLQQPTPAVQDKAA